MIYTILDEYSRTCEVSGHDNESIPLGNLTIPEIAKYGDTEYKVTSIGKYAFDECRNLESVIIPNSVISIGKDAFFGCSGLKSVTFGNSVVSIGDYAFCCTWNLMSITIPDSVITIGESAFDMSGLFSVTLGNSVAFIGKHAFYDCYISSITIPNSVTFLGSDIFGATGFPSYLEEVHINSIESWLKIKFESYSANPVSYTGNLLLNGQPLTELTIPEGTDSINNFMFYNCQSLNHVTFPKGVKHIGMSAFRSSGVKRFDFEDVNDYLCLDYASYSARLTYETNAQIYAGGELFQPVELVWPGNLTAIPDFAFFGDTFLKRIIIPRVY